MPQFFERAEPNALWQTDLVEDEPTAAGAVHGVFILDDHSRYCVGRGFFSAKTADNVLLVHAEAASRYGLPLAVLSDIGSQFQVIDPQARAQEAKTRYRLGWESLGVTVTYAAPYHPQTKGKEARFNRFVKGGLSQRSARAGAPPGGVERALWTLAGLEQPAPGAQCLRLSPA